ncbi:hypothetical protein ACM8BJ_24020 [Pseudomonas aeruginosa]|nr:hypothetical protein [Pseudomonas aeruginosa]MDY1219159.1 hypothetical protein [Pseudomonas aeruginosa]
MEGQHIKAGDARRIIAILLGLALAIGVVLLMNYNYQKRDEPVDLTTASTAQKTNWLQDDYVNEFGDKTGERYITNRVLFRGTYSNSAVDGNPLYVRIRADADQNFALQFFENYPSYDYRKRQYSDLKYDVIIQDSTGETFAHFTFEGVASGASLRIVDKSYRGDLLASLMNDEKGLKFFIRGQKRKIETYRFDISSGQIAGFTNALHKIIPPAISSDEIEDRETFNEKAFPHAISPASPAEQRIN